MDLPALRIFVRVAALASFTRAAEQLGLTKGRVSLAVQQVEQQVGTRLLQRTTRTVKLTPDGEEFLERCNQLLADAEQLQTLFQPAASGLRGRLRIDMPHAIARDVIIPRLPEFLSLHPLLEVGVSTTDRHVDLIQEGFDCVLRIGQVTSHELVARSLGVMMLRNVASPSYLRTYGTPTSLDDLAQHRIVHYAPHLGSQAAGWEYHDGRSARLVPMRAAVVVNGTDAYLAACLAGLGIIQTPGAAARQLIDAGLLVEVLADFKAAAMPVSLLYPHRRQLPPRVKAALGWITEVMTPYLAQG